MGANDEIFHVVGIVQERMSPAAAYVSRHYLNRMRGDSAPANSFRVVLDRSDRDFVNSVKADLDQNLERERLRFQISSKGDGRFSFDQHMLMIYVGLVVISGAIVLIGGLGLMTTMSLNVMERRRETGILRAIGASPRIIWIFVVAESLFIGILSWALATLASWPLSLILGNLLINTALPGGIDFQFAFAGILVWFVVCIVLGAAASFMPAWHASRLTVREALTHP
jgi:putative ABC transport system permease protein